MVKLKKKSLSSGSFRTHGRVIGNKNFFIFGLTRIITVRHLGKTERHKLTIPQKFITYRSKAVIFPSFSKTESWKSKVKVEKFAL